MVMVSLDLNSENLEVEFKILLNLANNRRVSWSKLKLFLNDLTNTYETSKKLNDVLLEELQSLHSQRADDHDKTKPEVQDAFENWSDNDSRSTDEMDNDAFQFGETIIDNESSYLEHDKKFSEDEPDNVHDDNFEDFESNEKSHHMDNLVYQNIDSDLNVVWFSDEEEIDQELDILPSDLNEGNKNEKRMLSKNEERKFACETCGQLFTKLQNLQLHEKIHLSKNPFNCKYCDKTFNQSQNLEKHEKIHKSKKSFQCKSCSKTFSLYSHLKRHERIHSAEKPYKCKYCAKMFTESQNLKKHEKIHTGDKPFQCTTCHKKFISRYELTRHNRFHTGERPFECEKCGKKYTNKGQLKIHEKNHTGEKAFSCKECPKKFKTMYELTQHGKTHSKVFGFECKV